MITACVQRMAHAVLLGTGEGMNSKNTETQSVDAREPVLTRALVFRKNECLHENVESYSRSLERCTVRYARSRRSLRNRPMPRPICPRPRISAARRTLAVYPPRTDSRYSRTSGGGQDRWQSAVHVLVVGRAGGGLDRCPTANNSLQDYHWQ